MGKSSRQYEILYFHEKIKPIHFELSFRGFLGKSVLILQFLGSFFIKDFFMTNIIKSKTFFFSGFYKLDSQKVY